MNAYDNGADWKATRQLLVWKTVPILAGSRPPANEGFVELGLLYGNGDFKQSMISAINCGDDTDCSGATVGSLLGILHGTAGIPADWREYIGEKIITMAVNKAAFIYGWPGCPNDCKELTERTVRLIPGVFAANNIEMEFTDSHAQYEESHLEKLKNRDYAEILCRRSGYSYDIDLMYTLARVEFIDSPKIKPNETKKIRITYYNKTQQSQNISFRFILPEGWSSKVTTTVMLESREQRSKYV